MGPHWYGVETTTLLFLDKNPPPPHYQCDTAVACHTDLCTMSWREKHHNLHSNSLSILQYRSKDIAVLTKMKLTYWRKDQKCKKAVFDKVSPSLARRPLPGAANKIVITYHYTSIHCTGRCLTSVSGRYFLLYIVSVVL